MKTRLLVTVLIILIAGISTTAICQPPDLVYVENGVERKIEGIEKTKPYFIENGEKKYFSEEGECFLKKKDDDFLSWGYPTVNYFVKTDKEGILNAVVIIVDESRKDTWNSITIDSLLNL